MGDFCEKCDNLLIYISRANGTIKECQLCHIPTEPTESDSLRYQVSKIEVAIDKTTLNFSKNVTNKKIARTCRSCGNGFARIFRTGDMTTYIKCVKCEDLRVWQDEEEEKTQKSRK